MNPRMVKIALSRAGWCLIVVLSLLLVPLVALAQQYNIDRISIEEGLSRSGVYDIIEDQSGFLWIATEGGGVDVFDGKGFKNYSTVDGLPTNVIRCLFEDSNQEVWFGTEAFGAIRYNNGEFETYSTDNGISHSEVRDILQSDDGRIWFATLGGGVSILNLVNDSFEYINTKNGLLNNKVRVLLKDNQGRIWIGTDSGISLSDNGHIEAFEFNADLPDKRILCLFEDNARNIWIGTRKGVMKFSPKNGQVALYTQEEDGLVHNRVRSIGQDNLGNIWLGTKIGLSKYDGKNFLSFTEKQGLSNNRIRKILLDRSGNLWFGTYFGGIDKFTDETFVHFTEREGLISHQVFSIEADESLKSLWLGTFEGLELLSLGKNGELLDTKIFKDFLGQEVFHVEQLPESELLVVGSNEGLFLLDRREKVIDIQHSAGLLGGKTNYIESETQTQFWVATDKGLNKIILPNGSLVPQSEEVKIEGFLAGKPSYSIYIDRKKKRKWIGHSSGMVTILQDEKPITFTLPDVTHNILQIHQDKFGNTWLGTEGDGLVRISKFNKINDELDIQTYSAKHGLTSNFIQSMVFDQHGALWLGTEKGLDKITFDDEANITRIRHIGKEEGFVGIETNKNAVAIDWDKNIWFGTIKGMTRYKSVAQSKNTKAPYIHITKVSESLLGTNWSLPENAKMHDGLEGRFALPKNLVLPYWDNSLIFEFIGISLKAPHKVEYEWMLEGYDYTWNAPSSKTEIMYSNLPYGEYTFKVKASNEDGVWNKEPAQFTFTIEKPFWREYWFYALAIISGYLVLSLFFRWRTRQLNQAKKKLEKLVGERTVEVQEKNAVLEQQKEELHTTLEHIQMQKKAIENEKDKSEQLLLNILPKATAKELREQGTATPKFYEQVTIMFTDFKGFTQVAEKLTPTELVKELEQCFLGFDEILDKYELEKIKTIGDSYMCAGGVPIANKTNAEDAIRAGLEIQRWMEAWKLGQKTLGKPFWDVRIGINTGEVVAGVVGKKKFAYDIWGDAVNLASRMESSGEPGKVNISGITYELVKDKFQCEYRGKVQAKNKGEVDMYFVVEEK